MLKNIKSAPFHNFILKIQNFVIYLRRILINIRIMNDLNCIKVVLVQKKKTGKWLAEQLHKSPCTISKWCSNTTQPDLLVLNRIAQLLKVDVKDLLNDTSFETQESLYHKCRNWPVATSCEAVPYNKLNRP